MDSDIKPIETRYRGYRFRSRLEARWAVFFDVLGIKYEYEAQGFDLGEAGWYLPDFKFVDTDWYGEVKPDMNLSDSDLRKVQQFDNHPPEGAIGLIMLIGSPTMFIGPAPSGNRSADSTWNVCGRFHIFDRQSIGIAIDAARGARFDGKDRTVETCTWLGIGCLTIIAACGYEYPEDYMWADADRAIIYCPGCGKRIKSEITE